MKRRSSGILMHISSLPSPYGIGDFGKEAYKFVDFLKKSGQKYWQILPLGVTGFGDSPYQCFSAFAGNPYFIDLDELINLDYLKIDEVEILRKRDEEGRVNFQDLYIHRMKILRIAYGRARGQIFEELKFFYGENKVWLREFALFMSLKDKHGGSSLINWHEDYRDFNSSPVLQFERENREEIYFWIFTQYFFFQQWRRLKLYANKEGISIIGDLPIYVALDSSDLWARPELFNLDDDLIPITVAGVPPDDFAEEGQLWGNPIYDWNRMKEEGYTWWIRRIKSSFKLYDVLRIDHFIGFQSYYEVDYGVENAVEGKRKKGPGIGFFNKIEEELGKLNIIAEDLGVHREDVRKLIRETGFPGMKVLQFAFNSMEESEHLPHNCHRNTVVYTGTHDNPTTMFWAENLGKRDFKYTVDYLNICKDEELNWGLIRGAWSSRAYLAIAPIQDLLSLGEEARMNTPSKLGGNWSFRIKKNSLTEELADKIAYLTNIYGR